MVFRLKRGWSVDYEKIVVYRLFEERVVSRPEGRVISILFEERTMYKLLEERVVYRLFEERVSRHFEEGAVSRV